MIMSRYGQIIHTSECRMQLSCRYLIIAFFCFLSEAAYSQKYFQQEVNYKITVTLNDRLHELSSFESMEYINNSEDTLHIIYFHLWPNAYSSNKTDLAKQLIARDGKSELFNDPELKGYIDSLDFKVQNRKVIWNLSSDQPDICLIKLNEPLIPGDTIIITTPFHVKIPKGVTSRLGHIGESYQISQWYPKPAVYNNTGWHQMPYLDQGEFFSEFGNFDVSITLPSNYTIGASGDLITFSEKLRMDSLAVNYAQGNIEKIRNDDFPPSSHRQKTLHYTGSQIHDFAWFADKRFHVLKGKVILPESGREVTTWAMFTNKEAHLWKNSIDYINSSVEYYSTMIGDYPYRTFTAVQSALNAGAGMEYPGLTVIGIADDGYSLNGVLTHEICHNWFYSALASDERRYPFMDEGLTSTYEMLYMNEFYPDKKMWELVFDVEKVASFMQISKMPVQRLTEIEWLLQAGRNREQPLDMPATDYSYTNYGTIIYTKAAIGFNYLRSYIGDSAFDAVMHNYYHIWKSRHPGPDDLRKVFESSSYKDLSWFFDDFISTTKRVDYKVSKLKDDSIYIVNNGEMLSPVVIQGLRGDSVYFEKWTSGFTGGQWIDIPKGSYSEVMIDHDHVMPELNRLNNNIHTSGILTKRDPLNPRFIFTVEDPGKRYVLFMPALNWTREDGLMFGLAFNNGLITPKPVEYFFMPFWTFKDRGLAGFGRIAFNVIPYNNLIRLATVSFEGTQFGAPGNQNYQRIKAGLDITFSNGSIYNPAEQKVYGNYIAASDLFMLNLNQKAEMLSYFQIGYFLKRSSIKNPFSFYATLESNSSYKKIAADFFYRFSYYGKSKGLEIRVFTGSVFKNRYSYPFYSLAPSGRSGRDEYLYNGMYPDRFSVFPNSFFSRQMTLSEGGLVSPVNDSLGYSKRLFSLSLTSNMPAVSAKFPVKPFINILMNDHGVSHGHDSPLFFEAGFKAGIWDLFEIYVPVVVSENIESVTGSFKNRIRFVIKLDSFKQFKLNK